MTEKQKYYRLLSIVCEELPALSSDTAVRQGHPSTASSLNAVRHGRLANLQWLIDLIHIGLPDFEVPAELLPSPKPALV